MAVTSRRPLRVYTVWAGAGRLIPDEAGTAAVLGDPALEEVLFLAEIDRLAHPGEGIAGPVLPRQADPLQTAVGDVLDVLTEEIGVEAEHAGREAVFSVGDFEVD